MTEEEEKLKMDLSMSPDALECCKILVDYCLKEDKLSEDQFKVILDMFGEEVIASYSLMYIYSISGDFDRDNLKESDIGQGSSFVDDLFKILYDKFIGSSEHGVVFSSQKHITA